MYKNEEFDLLKKVSGGIKSAELNGLISTIEGIYAKYNQDYLRYTENYKATMENAFDNFRIAHLIHESSGGKLRNSMPEDYKRIKETVSDYCKQLDKLRHLEFLSQEKKTVVFVGPNGCGKTMLMRSLIEATGEEKIGYYPADRLLVIDDSYSPERNFEAFAKSYKYTDRRAADLNETGQTNYITRQINQAIALFEKTHAKELDAYKNNEITLEDCRTEQILKIWNGLIRDRKLYSDGTLAVKPLEGEDYPIKYLSGGEKSILYFLTCIILKDPKEFYFIDEPENNLNPSVVSKLWDIIEAYRPQSIFVYLTHDSNFVASRVNSRLFWIEKYDGKEWKYRPLPQNDNLPQELMIELVGNRAPVLFCESHDEYKLDDVVFQMMFPEFKIVPAAGCDGVISKVKSYKVAGLPQKAYGIIDCDYHEDEYLKGQEKNRIYHLPFFEIENFLMCEEIIKGVISSYSIDPANAFENVKTALKKDFVSRKEQWVVRKIGFRLRDIFFNKKIKDLKYFSELNEKYRQFQEKIDLEAMFSQYMEEIKQVIAADDYDTYLKYYDNKGILSDFAAQLRLRDKRPYEEVVFEYLKGNKAILDRMRKKYFAPIAQ